MDDEEYLGQYYDEEMPIPEIRNTGVLYEQYLYSFYRDRGMIPQGFTPPKMGGHGIDLKLFMRNYSINTKFNQDLHRKKRLPMGFAKGLASGLLKDPKGVGDAYKYVMGGGDFLGGVQGIELKLSPEDDYGSSALSYQYSTKKWILTGKMSTENVENRKLLTAANVLQVINEKWKGKEPLRFRYKSGTPAQLPKEAKAHDVDAFPETVVDLPGIKTACANYYSSKQCNYINISSHGLYYFNKDPMGLSIIYGIPKFSNAVSSMGVRFRPKMGGSFGFAVSMKITGNITKSRVNLNDANFAQDLQDDAKYCTNAPYFLQRLRNK